MASLSYWRQTLAYVEDVADNMELVEEFFFGLAEEGFRPREMRLDSLVTQLTAVRAYLDSVVHALVGELAYLEREGRERK